MLKILQARLQQCVNHELPYVQAGFRKARGTRNQIANIQCIIKKAREFQKNIYCFIYDPMDVGNFFLWFLCLFEIQLVNLEVLGSSTVEA